MRLTLVRHGETAYNRDGLGLGRADPPLTDLGLRQTAAAIERLAAEPPDRILTSPLGRAAAIARGLAERTGAPLEVREALTEMDVGETEGLPFAEMRERFPGFIEAWRAPDPADVVMPGGESLAQVAARLEPLVAELHAFPDDASVVAVAIGAAIVTFSGNLSTTLTNMGTAIQGITVDTSGGSGIGGPPTP